MLRNNYLTKHQTSTFGLFIMPAVSIYPYLHHLANILQDQPACHNA